eukprot:TRINITY_DN22641_c0_g1_i1.p2 TRINITY_DN22641_c0_g1~~TRINITY_DN22641_c0_g1_i1.p2  ORF type:complete len:204 (+),score=53.90 TRINITY_DN22641_c0_g1_i1:74-685(+)
MAFPGGGKKGFKGGKGGGMGGKGGFAAKQMDEPQVSQLDESTVQMYEAMFGPANEDDAARNLMINYIPNRVTEDELRMVFSVYGPVEHLRIICDKNTNESKGYGFVKYLYGISAYSAVSFLTGYQVYHKRLKVSYAHQDQAAAHIASPATQAMWERQLPKLMEYYMNCQESYGAFMQRMQQLSNPMGMGHDFGPPGHPYAIMH